MTIVVHALSPERGGLPYDCRATGFDPDWWCDGAALRGREYLSISRDGIEVARAEVDHSPQMWTNTSGLIYTERSTRSSSSRCARKPAIRASADWPLPRSPVATEVGGSPSRPSRPGAFGPRSDGRKRGMRRGHIRRQPGTSSMPARCHLQTSTAIAEGESSRFGDASTAVSVVHA